MMTKKLSIFFFLLCPTNLFCNFFTEEKKEINIDQSKKTTENVVFLLFYKEENRQYLDLDSLKSLAKEMARYVVRDSNIFLKFISLKYSKQTYLGRQLYQPAADELVTYLTKNKLLSHENQKLLIYTVSDSMDSLGLATKNKLLPKNSIHTILSLDAEASVIPDFEKIEHRLYGFYVPRSGWRTVSLWKSFFKQVEGGEQLFDAEKLFAKVVNIRCLYENVTEEEPRIKEIKEASFYELFQKQTNHALTKLIAQIDAIYHLNNDLNAILFSNREAHWRNRLPLAFMNNMFKLEQGDLSLELHNANQGYFWQIDDEFSDKVKEKFEKEGTANFKATRVLYDYVDVTKEKNPELFKIVVDHEQKYDSFYQGFKGVLQTLGIRYIPYETEKNLIGPFFIPIEDELYIVALAKEGFDQAARIKINRGIELEFDVTLPFKYGYVVLKTKITDFSGDSYEILPSGIKGKIPEFENVDAKTPYSFFVYGDLRKHDRSKLHKKTTEKTSIAYKTKELLESKRGILHLLTGDLVVDGSSPHDWAEFLDVVLHPLTRDQLVISAIGNHDITSSMGVGLSVYRYFFHPAVPHFGNLFYFTQSSKADKISVTKHVAETQNWFDVGAVRFIHLPLPTEETRGHYEEVRHSKVDETRSWLTGMTCCNFSAQIWENFEKSVKLAHQEKKEEKIKFIVVYGHAPLVTAPAYKMHHTGIFNFMIEQKGQERKLQGKEKEKYWFALALKRIFKNYAIDAYFCGHNHLYDRCDWKINDDLSIPMVTMGLGTGMHGSHVKHKVHKELNRHIKSQKLIYKKRGKAAFIGYLECAVQPNHNKIMCGLYGRPGKVGEIAFVGEMPVRKDVADAFVINTRPAR